MGRSNVPLRLGIPKGLVRWLSRHSTATQAWRPAFGFSSTHIKMWEQHALSDLSAREVKTGEPLGLSGISRTGKPLIQKEAMMEN